MLFGKVDKKTIELIKVFTINNFKIKYKGSKFGYLWSFINPLLMLITLYIVFSFIMKFDMQYYQLYLLMGILVWNFLSEATTTSMLSIVSRGDMIKKIRFPNSVIVVSSCLTSLIIFLFNLVVFFILAFVVQVEFSWTLLALPVYMIELFIIVLGISFIVSALYVKYRDLIHIWSFFLLMGFWITPIVYPVQMVPIEYMRYYMLNPMARIIVDMRDCVLYNWIPNPKNTVISFLVSIITLLIGYFVFRKFSRRFAEEM
jgi:lipopolysaccharide transport system permease protein